MPFNLGIMSVGFEMDLSGLTSGASKAETIIEGLSSIGEEAGASLTESFSMPEDSMGLLVDGLDRIVLHLRTMLDSVDELTASVDAGFAQMAEEASLAAEQMDNSLMSVQEHAMSAGNAVREAGSSSHAAGGGFLSMAGNVGMAVMGMQMAIQVGQQLAQTMLTPAENAEQMGKAFTTLLGSTKAANQELHALSDFSDRTSFTEMQIDQLGAQLIGMGIATKDVIPDLKAMGDNLAAVGHGSVDDLKQVVDVFGKINVNGKLMGGDLQQLSEHGINATEILAKGFHKSNEEIQKMASQGLISAKDGLAMLTKGIEANPMFKDQMAHQATTMTGLLSTLASKTEKAASAFMGLKDGQVQAGSMFDMLEKGIGKVGDLLSSKGFQEFASKTGKQIADIMQNLGKFFSNPGFKQFADLLGGTIAKGFEQLMGYLSSPAFGNFQKLMGDVMGNSLKTLMPFLKSIIKDFEDFGKQVGPILTPIIQNFAKYLASPQFQSFVKVIGEGIAGAIHIALPLIKDIIANVVKFGQEVAERLQPLIQKFMEWWNEAWPGIASVFKGVWDMISGVVKVAWSLISGIIKIGLDLLSGNWDQAWTDMLDMLKGIGNGIKQFLKGLLEGLGGLIWAAGAAIFDALKKPFADAWSFISGVFGNIGQLFNDLVSLNFGAIPGDMQKLIGLPSFAGGVQDYGGGLAQVHKDEIVYLPPHSSVYTASQSAAMLAGGGSGEIHLHNHVYLDGREMTAQLMPHMNQAALARLGPRARVA